MIFAARQILRTFRDWDRSTQIAFMLALVLLTVGLILIFTSPQEQRPIIFIGVIALLFVAELAVLWGNRGMVTVYTKAQRRYLAGDLDGTRTMLEAAREKGQADMHALTLLGSTYRQFGMLSESETVLYEALDKAPTHHFPLYNLGRTLLSAGRYDEAIALFERALESGAAAVTRFDLAEAKLFQGKHEEAGQILEAILGLLREPHRAFMASWWLYRLGVESTPPPAELVESGLPYWEAAAGRFAQTPYGQAIAAELAALKGWIEGEA